jgi:response regulator RpfG family c-di-GMP phosphodiesterase
MDQILIIDGDPKTPGAVSAWLSEMGLDPCAVSSLADARLRMKRGGIGMVLLGLSPADGSALEFCRELKRNDATSHVPVLAFNPGGRGDSRLEALKAGAEGCLSLPPSREEIAARVGSLIRVAHLRERLILANLHMDSLGTFADSYAERIVADMTPEEVAFKMADQLIGGGKEGSYRPTFVWGGVLIKDKIHGLSFRWDNGVLAQGSSVTAPGAIEEALAPFERGRKHFLANEPLPHEARRLLGIRDDVAIPNFAAIFTETNAIVAGAYPGPVDAYEFPILRASIRYWSVALRLWKEQRKTEKAFFYMMEALALAAEFQDPHIAAHLRRVNGFAEVLARGLDCDGRFLRWIGQCAQMHDVGKITIPREILHKPLPLDPVEMILMRRHTVNGYIILSGNPNLAMAAAIARSHHENFDGTGYPDGLRGEAIPIEARIVKVVDIYDALRTQRPYKPAIPHDEAVAIIRKGDDRVTPEHLDPRVLEAFLDHQREILDVFEDAASSVPD